MLLERGSWEPSEIEPHRLCWEMSPPGLVERLMELEELHDPPNGGGRDRWRKSILTWHMSGRRVMEMGQVVRVEVGSG